MANLDSYGSSPNLHYERVPLCQCPRGLKGRLYCNTLECPNYTQVYCELCREEDGIHNHKNEPFLKLIEEQAYIWNKFLGNLQNGGRLAKESLK